VACWSSRQNKHTPERKDDMSDHCRPCVASEGEKPTIADLMPMGNIEIKPDGSIKEKEPPVLTDEQQAAADALPVRQFGDSY